MFVRYATLPCQTLTIFVDDQAIDVSPGISVAAALLANGFASTRRTPVTGSPRGPWCLMGACFDCLVTIDGVAAVQACMTTVCEGMHIALPGPDQRSPQETESDPWGPSP